MKWDCGPEWHEIKAKLEDWHPFFAVLPKKVAPHDCRWLERIERRGRYVHLFYEGWWEWEYRPMGKTEAQK